METGKGISKVMYKEKPKPKGEIKAQPEKARSKTSEIQNNPRKTCYDLIIDIDNNLLAERTTSVLKLP